METIVVTGASGSIGSRVSRLLANADGVQAVLAVDLKRGVPKHQRIVATSADLLTADLKELFEGATTVVHVASSFDPSKDGLDTSPLDLAVARRVFDAAAAIGAERLVVLSSAMVYGAWPDNPMPITEDIGPNPNPEFAFAEMKAELETLADAWQDAHPSTEVVVLRPTTALAEGETSWVARSLKAAAVIDAGEGDPPLQFLHLDDLATAVALASRGSMRGYYNVAPDSWVEGETYRELSGRVPRLRLPEEVADQLGRFRWRHGIAPTPPGLTPYTIHPWVIANDRLRDAGWTPGHSNEEAYVDGTPPKPWATLNAKRRQQIALGAATAIGAVAGLGIVALVRRLRRAAGA